MPVKPHVASRAPIGKLSRIISLLGLVTAPVTPAARRSRCGSFQSNPALHSQDLVADSRPKQQGIYLGISGKDLKAPDILAVGLGDIYLDTYSVVALDDRLKDIVWTDDRDRDIEMALNTLASEPTAPATLEPFVDAIDIHFSEPTLPGIIASLKNESRTELTDWANQTLAVLEKRTPLLMAVTLEQLHRGRRMSLADCFRMELNLVHACFDQGDFIEGVRALIVDKDQWPRWRPPILTDVMQSDIDEFFTPRWSPREHPLSALR